MITNIFRWSYKCQSWENERLRHQTRGISLVADFELCLWEKQLIKRLRPCWCVRGRLRGGSMSGVRKTRTDSICLCHIRVSMCRNCTLAIIHHQYCLRPFVSFQSFFSLALPHLFLAEVSPWWYDSKTQWAHETISHSIIQFSFVLLILILISVFVGFLVFFFAVLVMLVHTHISLPVRLSGSLALPLTCLLSCKTWKAVYICKSVLALR